MVSSPQSQDLPARVARLEALLDAESRKSLFSAVISSGGLTIENGGGITLGPGGNINMSAGGKIKDGAGDIILSADALSGAGLSTPFVPIPMYPAWAQSFPGSAYPCIAASACTAETQIWAGIIPQAVWPLLFFEVLVGRVTGSTSNATYRFYVNSGLINSIASPAFGFQNFAEPILAPLGVAIGFGSENVGISITIQSNVTSGDFFAAGVANVAMTGN